MQIYIDGIPEDITEKDLAPLLSGVRSLEATRVIRDITSGRSKGFALATLRDDAEGQAAIARLNGAMFRGKRLTVFKVHDTLPGEMEFREWLRDNAEEALRKAGLSEAQTVVDYGCGPGIFSLAAARIVGQLGKVYALDVRPRALQEVREIAANENLRNIETRLLDRSAVTVALADRIADALLLYDVLQEIPDKPGLMREAYRLLKPGGVLSVFPMHLGTGKLLDIVEEVGLFGLGHRITYPGFHSASVVVNLSKGS